MPATEAMAVGQDSDERLTYELAFHVLPTVAEGEVGAVFDAVKALIIKVKGEILGEEAPERFDLAYEVEKHLEGKNRKFQSAYFGWVRFKAESRAIAEITHELEVNHNILRHLLIKLTKAEEQNPFRFHESLKDQKMVTTVEDSEVIPDFTTVSEAEKGTTAVAEEVGEVDEEELEKALEKKDIL